LLCNDDRTILEAVRKKNGDGKQMLLFESTKESVAALYYVFLTLTPN